MTLEGCVVRISDLIAYLGRDIEDGIRLNIIKQTDIPKEITNVLGWQNRDIISTIINDLIANSQNKNYLLISKDVFKAIQKLMQFNYEHIYALAYTKKEKAEIETMFKTLFNKYLTDLKQKNGYSKISKYYKVMSKEYQNNSKERIVIDYIAGMTDQYILKEYNKILKTKHNRKEV